MKPADIDTTVVVPTFNEAGNVEELTRRLTAACRDLDVEIVFVDDSTDETPAVIAAVAKDSSVPVRLIHRVGAERVGGLSGAVVRGIQEAHGRFVAVMDGDLQHPPEMVPLLRSAAAGDQVDVVVASRYVGDGSASGLSDSWRRMVSSASTALARLAFPSRVGRRCTDPMTGFFCLRRDAVDVAELRPRGFKILLELLVRRDLTVLELPFAFGARTSGDSKASWRQGMEFLLQLLNLRFGRTWSFALVGLSGVFVNLAVMDVMIGAGMHYLPAAIVATEVAIVSNFALQERFVFADVRQGSGSLARRAATVFAFNNTEHLVRIPFLVLLVELALVPAVTAQAATLLVAFVGRFVFFDRVVYRPVARPSLATAVDLEVAT